MRRPPPAPTRRQRRHRSPRPEPIPASPTARNSKGSIINDSVPSSAIVIETIEKIIRNKVVKEVENDLEEVANEVDNFIIVVFLFFSFLKSKFAKLIVVKTFCFVENENL